MRAVLKYNRVSKTFDETRNKSMFGHKQNKLDPVLYSNDDKTVFSNFQDTPSEELKSKGSFQECYQTHPTRLTRRLDLLEFGHKQLCNKEHQ